MKKTLGVLIALGILSLDAQAASCQHKQDRCFRKCDRKHHYKQRHKMICDQRCVEKHRICKINRSRQPAIIRPVPVPTPGYYGWGPKHRHHHRHHHHHPHYPYYWR